MHSAAVKEMLLQSIDELPGLKGKGLCREYLLGRQYAAHRIGRVVGPKSRNVLQFLLDSPEEDERLRLYPENFDLGNMHSSGPATLAALKHELEPDKDKRTSALENFFRSARDHIPALTGHELAEYMELDSRKTLKVIKLLYQLNASTPVQLFSFLKPPSAARDASFEVATSHPIEHDKAVSATVLLADLTTQLAVELSPETRDDIEDLYVTLREKIDGIESGILRVAMQRSGGKAARLEKLLALVRDMLARQALVDDNSAGRQLLPLDEQLCLHCHGLEFLNYAQAHRDLVTMPALAGTTPIGANIASLDSAVLKYIKGRVNRPEIPLSKFVPFAQSHDQLLIAILSDYLGHKVRPSDYKEAVPLALRLIEIWVARVPGSGLLDLANDAIVQPMSLLAALAAVCHQQIEPTQYYPYWHAQPNDRGNVISALGKIDMRNFGSRVPEGFMRFWDHQIKWHGHALFGQQAIYEHKLAITQHFVVAFEHPVRSQNTDLLRKRIQDYAQLPLRAAELLDQAVANN
jgi:hypothetical protein